jgi:tRNA threonylcarbamoyladenosine biosynthesis protein TsaB
VITLVLDASTYTGTLAVLAGEGVVAAAEVVMRGADEERLLPAVALVLERAGIAPSGLGGIVCGEGPGSFTSLRIAASIAKGLAFGGGIPLQAVSSLALLVASSDATRAPGRYLAALDALRGEHYVATCDVGESGEVVAVGAVERWPTDALRVRAASVGRLVGPGLDLDVHPAAAGVTRLGSLLARTPPVDLARWEPAYGRLAEAQVKWEAAHGRALPAS